MKNIRRSILLSWIPLLLYCTLVFYLSAIPGPNQLPRIKYDDKILHLGAFALMGFLCFRAFRFLGTKRSILKIVILSLAFSTIFGICIEINQYFIPYRSAEALDIVADVLGSLVGIFIAVYSFKKRA